jgi:hypothetical protein
MLLFWFEVMETGVRLILEIGPGPREIRQKMLDAANENRPLFDPQSKTVGRKYNRIYRKRLVSAKPLRERNLEGCFDELDQAWAKFLEDDLARMGAYLSTALASHAGR